MNTDTIPGTSTATASPSDVRCRTVVVANPQGLHLRPVAAFAKRARDFTSRVTVLKEGFAANGKSQIELVMLAASMGTELTLEVAGADAEAAVGILAGLLAASGADEDE